MSGRAEPARVQLTDVVITGVVSVAAYALAPVYYSMIDLIVAEADPLSALLLELVVPMLFLGIVISLGVSARRAE
jgi:hypothetical protein